MKNLIAHQHSATFFTMSVCFALLCLPGFVSSQAYNTTYGSVSSPSAAGLSTGKFVDIPVSQYTGTASPSIPMHTIQSGALTVPIGISYHTGGLRVATPASEVGLGWSLQAGGMVSRTIMGLPDDQHNGYMNLGSGVPEDAPGTWNVQGGASDDTEPDIFTFNAPGISGKFFVTANQQVIEVPKSDNKIEIISSNSGNYENLSSIDAILITSPSGAKYYFGKDTYNGAAHTAYDETKIDNPNNPRVQRIGWHLRRINSADDKNFVTFSYVRSDYLLPGSSSCPTSIKYIKDNDDSGVIPPPCNFAFGIKYFSQIIQNISTNKGLIAAFYHEGRPDLENFTGGSFKKKIDRVDFLSTVKFGYDFTYDTFESSSNLSESEARLKLVSVQKVEQYLQVEPTGLEEPPFEFTYYGHELSHGKQFFPKYNDKNIDHWGYYNGLSGQDNNVKFTNTPATQVSLSGGVVSHGESYRESDESSMLIGNLESIKYPTGGTMLMSLSSNSYNFGSPSETVIVQAQGRQDCFADPKEKIDSFSVQENQLNTSSIRFILIPFTHRSCPFGNIAALALQVTSTDTSISRNYNAFDAPVEHVLTLDELGITEAGNYTFEATISGGSVAVYLLTQDNIERECGGLKVDSTTVSDGLSDTDNDIVTSYKYETEEGTSSGVLFQMPKYGHAVNDNTAVFFENSISPLSSFNGIHVGYSRVITQIQGKGETVQTFLTPNWDPPQNEFPATVPTYNVNRGTTHETTVFNENGNQLSNRKIIRRQADADETYGSHDVTGFYHHAASAIPVCVGNDITNRWAYLSTRYYIRTNVYRPSHIISDELEISTTQHFTYDERTANLLPYQISLTHQDLTKYTTTNTFINELSSPEIAIKTAALSKNIRHIIISSETERLKPNETTFPLGVVA